MKLFKRYHPLAVKGGWGVCDGDKVQRDSTKNEPAVPINGTIYSHKSEAQTECDKLNK